MKSLFIFAVACLSLLLVMWGWRMGLRSEVAEQEPCQSVSVEGSNRDRKMESQESQDVSLDAVAQLVPLSNFDDLVGGESLERLEIFRILDDFKKDELKAIALEGFERRLEWKDNYDSGAKKKRAVCQVAFMILAEAKPRWVLGEMGQYFDDKDTWHLFAKDMWGASIISLFEQDPKAAVRYLEPIRFTEYQRIRDPWEMARWMGFNYLARTQPKRAVDFIEEHVTHRGDLPDHMDGMLDSKAVVKEWEATLQQMSPGPGRTAFAEFILPIVGRDFGFEEGFQLLEAIQPLDLSKEHELWVWCLRAPEYHSPEAAEFILERLRGQDEEKRHRKIQLFSIAWSRLDLTAASVWILQQPSGKEKDALIEGVISNVSQRNPEDVTGWIEAISDPERKEQLLKRKRYR